MRFLVSHIYIEGNSFAYSPPFFGIICRRYTL